MKIDGVEFPDHVVEAFAKASDMDYPMPCFEDPDEPQWFRQVMLGFLENFYQGWKAREQYDPVGLKVLAIETGMANKLHGELCNWLDEMLQTGKHPTRKQLQHMVTMADIVKATISQIRRSLSYEEDIRFG